MTDGNYHEPRSLLRYSWKLSRHDETKHWSSQRLISWKKWATPSWSVGTMLSDMGFHFLVVLCNRLLRFGTKIKDMLTCLEISSIWFAAFALERKILSLALGERLGFFAFLFIFLISEAFCPKTCSWNQPKVGSGALEMENSKRTGSLVILVARLACHQWFLPGFHVFYRGASNKRSVKMLVCAMGSFLFLTFVKGSGEKKSNLPSVVRWSLRFISKWIHLAMGHKPGETLFIRSSARKHFKRQGRGACSSGPEKENSSCGSVSLFPIAVLTIKWW